MFIICAGAWSGARYSLIKTPCVIRRGHHRITVASASHHRRITVASPSRHRRVIAHVATITVTDSINFFSSISFLLFAIGRRVCNTSWPHFIKFGEMSISPRFQFLPWALLAISFFLSFFLPFSLIDWLIFCFRPSLYWFSLLIAPLQLSWQWLPIITPLSVEGLPIPIEIPGGSCQFERSAMDQRQTCQSFAKVCVHWHPSIDTPHLPSSSYLKIKRY